jgi:hypothetical protein
MVSDAALIIGIGTVSIVLMYFSQLVTEEHTVLKWFLSFSSIFILLLIPTSLIELTTYKTSSIFYKGYLWFIRIFVVYLFLYYLVYTPLMKWGWIGRKRDE